MRIMILAVLCSFAAPVVIAEVQPGVYFNDANTPLTPLHPDYPHVYRDIMVGTKLTIIIDSNMAEPWKGALAVDDANLNYGLLSCRDCNEVIPDCEGSRLPPAGPGAIVAIREAPDIHGYSLYTDIGYVMAGEWFAIDYTATEIGICAVGFYDYDVDWFDPIYYLTFSHVPSRDFNEDTAVDFGDFAVLSSYWLATSCDDPDWCAGADLDRDHDVDFQDASLFADYWLEKTELSDVTYCAMPPGAPG